MGANWNQQYLILQYIPLFHLKTGFNGIFLFGSVKETTE